LQFKGAKAVVFGLNLAFYWGGVPFMLLMAAVKLDRIVGMPGIPKIIGLSLGAIFLGAGALGAAWCTVTFYLRGGGFPIAFLPPNRLVRAGPYGLSRHPLYLSFTLYLLGWGLVGRSLSALVFVAPGVTLLWSGYALMHEERGLLRRFGERYARYREETPFFFRPRRGVPGPGILFTLSYIFGKPLVRAVFAIGVEGKENLPQSGPAVLIANHASYLDPIFLLWASDRYVRFLTKAEVMRTRFGRWFFTRVGSIPTSRYRIDPASVRGLLAALKEGEIVGVFPEGARTWDGRPLPVNSTVKRLLARVGVPIIPVQIAGSYAIYPRWAGHPLPGRLRIRILPPVSGDEVQVALDQIAITSDGRTWLARKAEGIERLLWACPSCRAIGSITTRGREIRCTHCGAKWWLDSELCVHSPRGESVPLSDFVSFLREEELFHGMEALTSIGEVDLFSGGAELHRVAAGKAVCNGETIRVGDRSISLSGARILRLEGRDRLDIGFKGEHRLRLRFHRDSPLKWARFLREKLTLA